MPAAALARPLPARGGPRPLARESRARRRLGRRLAAGLTPAEAARVEAVPAAEVEALLADPDFAGLVEAYKEVIALPEADARARLLRHARALLEEAVADGDVRAALFVWREERRGRDPAATLADGVIAAARQAATRAAADSPPESPPPSRPRPPADPADRTAWRTAEHLRAALVTEWAALHHPAAAERDAGVPYGPVRSAATLDPAHEARGDNLRGETTDGLSPTTVTPRLGRGVQGGRAATARPAPDRPGTRSEAAADAPPTGTTTPAPSLNRHQRRRRAALLRRRAPPRTTGSRGPP